MRTLSLILLASFTAGAGACVDDPSQLGEDELQLVGGFSTSARPEIGVFNNAAGSACTATLISRQVILTAAHCLSPQYIATTVAPGAVFMFTDRTGVGRTYGVDRVHSFATQRWEYQPDNRFTTDVALLHLSSPVSLAQAIPATIATRPPNAGQVATLVGFGCTDRTPQSGGGFKQAFEFNVGPATRALCWGDSGGPAFRGGLSSNGPVWGVNSDFGSWVISPDEMIDIFAGVPVYAKQIEDVVHGWDGANEIGVDRPGFDYASIPDATLPGCRVSCDRDGRCRAFTFVPNSPSSGLGRCWMKDGVSEPVPGSLATSGLASRIATSSDRGGNDYAMVPAVRAEVCAAACGRDLACQAWTHVPPSGGASGQCWLKGAVPAATTRLNLSSGVQVRELEPGVNRPGNDIAIHTTTTARACARKCAEDERCEAFTATSAASNNCFLKDAVPAATTGAGMASGVRRGLETNLDRPGGQYRSFPTSRLAPSTCQAACAREAQCQAWTYHPPVAPATAATCSLKSQVPPVATARGLVSGLKGLELLP